MNYPVWDLGPGAGLLIAVVSILHVFVSHFAVGGGLWLVFNERRARAADDSERLGFVKQHSRFFVLLTLVFGAITGVGIWITIGLLSPHGTSALIHGFVWGWAMEWVFFFVEIAAALVYYYGWQRLPARTHERVGWIYFGAALASLVIINGIVTFMLTPGGWLQNRDFWTGFFNPTYWPSLAVRTMTALALAGLFALWTAAGLPRGALRRRLTRQNAAWSAATLALTALGLVWYGHSIEIWPRSEALAGAIPVLGSLATLLKTGLVATGALCLLAAVVPAVGSRAFAALALLAALGTLGAGEWLREAGRKPFTIHGYLYSTGMRPDQEAAFALGGMAAGTRWLPEAAADDPETLGRHLYLAWCQPCHTLDGYNGLRPSLAHWSEETVASLLPRLQHLRALMPPWYGTEGENAALTTHLMNLRPAVADTASVDGPRAFALSCGLCHTATGYRALDGFLAGMSRDEIDEFLDLAGEIADEMPAYFGPPRQRRLLVDHLHELGRRAAAAQGSGS